MFNCIMSNNYCYQKNIPMKPVGIIVHSSGINNTNLSRYIQPDPNEDFSDLRAIGLNFSETSWNQFPIQTGAHIFIGQMHDGSIQSVQCLPFNIEANQSGFGVNGSCDQGWIQIIVCEDDLTNENYFKALYNELTTTITQLCRDFDLHPFEMHNGIPQILSHCEAYSYGMAVPHYDIDNWFPRFGKTMHSLRKDVAINLLSN